MIEQWVSELTGEGAASALSLLCQEAKKQAGRREIDRLLSDRAPLYAALAANDPKTRKNAARLLGALGMEADADRLCAALEKETQRFVIPSLLLALGAVGGSAAKRVLDAYTPPVPADATEEKHCAEIADALKKARGTFASAAPAQAFHLKGPREVLLTAPEGFAPVLLSELSALGFPAAAAPGGVLARTGDFSALFQARCFFEALIPVAEGVPADPAALGALFSPHLENRSYRVELRDYEGDRAKFIRAFTRAAAGTDNPSHYDFEARIVCRGALADAYFKPCRVPDTRFAYRKEALPASIHPATAAAIVRFAAPYCTAARPHVLDPFCGSGTLLFEREKRSPCASLTGVDVAGNAVRIARINAAAGRSRAKFVQKDCLRFDARGTFDEVIANLPFGNRVGTHADNEQLYAAFLKKLPELLSDGGTAVLYTMEYQLLRRCLRPVKSLTLAAEQRTEAGGLLPWVFILKKA